MTTRRPYEIHECTKCGAEIDASRLLPARGDAFARAVLGDASEAPTGLYHIRNEARGSGRPGVIGCHMVTVECGPVERRTVGLQEQFIHWLEGRAERGEP